MSNSLEVLAKNRDALLLAEVAGWLHDMKKCDEKHIREFALDGGKGTEPTDNEEGQYPQIKIESRDLSIPDEPPVKLQQLIKRGKPRALKEGSKQPWLVRTLGFCHAAAHTEKEEAYYLLQQRMADTRLSSSFGYEPKPLTGLRAKRDSLPLEQLPDRATLLPKIREAFSDACGDTRHPINDVTLWDWSNIVAAMYKAALAAALLGYKEEPPAMHWRLLSVRLNGAAFSERALRIPDLLARQKLITDGLDRVRRLLEEEYPLGAEVYRDENGSVFIVPDIPELLDLENDRQVKLSTLIINKFSAGTVRNKAILALKGEIVPFLDLDKTHWTRKMPGEIPSYTHQDPLPIAEHVKAEKVPSLEAEVRAVRGWWENSNEPTCPVCQLRPQGWGAPDNKAHYSSKARGEKCRPKPPCQTCKALDRKVCFICEERREDRSENWVTEDKLEKTIWIDEIADASGTLALVVGKFDLIHWLDGTMLFFPGIEQELFVDSFQLNALVHGIRGRVGGHYRILLDKSIESIAQTTVGDNWLIDEQNFQVKKKEGDDLNCLPIETVDSWAIQMVETQLLHPDRSANEQHFKPLPEVETHTPARLQRVWETARQFWKNCEDQLSDEDIVGKVGLRLRIEGSVEGGNRDNLGRYHTYEIKLRNIRVSVVYVEQDDDFLIIDNLRRVAALLDAPEEYQKDEKTAAAFVKDRLQKEKSLPLETPAGYGIVNEPSGTLQIGTVEEEYIAYPPTLTILSEPGTFMALVPADKALRVVDAIKRRYGEEMGKVRNRLPLTVGVIFTSSRTPLPAILDAGRRMLSQPTEDEEWDGKRGRPSQADLGMLSQPAEDEGWEVKEIVPPPTPQSWPSEVKLTLEREQRSISMPVPTVMGDRKTRDEWYPYWRMAFPVADAWVHICDLRKGDRVHLAPSHFDFEFLDAAARRFEVSYGNGKRRGEIHPARPYYLEQLDSFKELWGILDDGLATSQIHNLVGLIEEKRLEWSAEADSKTFKRMVCDILENAGWMRRPGKEQFEQLVQATLSGQLADVVEFYSFLDEQSKSER
jgi:hypothetical protein